ncbi:MAG TPA: DUF2786 domain-containing protein [Jiangellales bacterium]|nr:DUF2786 domain-containing protein [Jiangellales bacterium]
MFGDLGAAEPPPDPRTLAADRMFAALRVVAADPRTATEQARGLLATERQIPPPVLRAVVAAFLREVVAEVVAGGWLPSDLGALAARPATAAPAGLLAGLLRDEARRHPAPTVAQAWTDDLAGLGHPGPLDLAGLRGLADALRVGALVSRLPPIVRIIPPPGSRQDPAAGAVGLDPKVLAKVRALLAKAESTEFPEEAEALSTKAQQLISRYALDRLRIEDDSTDAPRMVTVRLWIDAPYVMPKATLVGAVARANRCRSVVTEDLGFCTLVGTASDVEAVELLSTSLLVQASTAMSRHGAHVDRWGRSRTRSFRQSFLVSYATRIGERLQEATDEAVEQSGSAELVPLLLRHDEHVEAAMEEMFPRLVSRQTSVSNGHGWAAGRAAADLAVLDARGEVTREAG